MASAKEKSPSFEVKARINDAEGWKKWAKSIDNNKHVDNSGGGALYFVGFIGALVYNWQAAVGFMAFVTGFLKSLVWPAYIVYKLLENFYGVVNF